MEVGIGNTCLSDFQNMGDDGKELGIDTQTTVESVSGPSREPQGKFSNNQASETARTLRPWSGYVPLEHEDSCPGRMGQCEDFKTG